MAKRWSVTGLLLAAGLMSGHASAVGVVLGKAVEPHAGEGRGGAVGRGEALRTKTEGGG